MITLETLGNAITILSKVETDSNHDSSNGWLVTIAIIAGIGAAAYAFYRIGKKNMKEPVEENDVFKNNPNTINAQRAFIKNLDKLLPYFSGATEIKVDKQGLTETIIDINDDDLIAIWKQMFDRTDHWISQMAAWGVKPDSCQSFVAMEKHKSQYVTTDNSELEIGERYAVMSACWILTTNEDNKSVKKVVKKGIVTKKL